MSESPELEAFDSPRADLVLRSSDGVDFRVEKTILIMSSSFFETMFCLPQPSADQGVPQDLPIVKMVEDGRTLDILLKLLYPNKYPGDMTLTELDKVMKAADKYIMHGVIEQLGALLRMPHYLHNEPFRIFALACQYGLQDLIQAAAKATLLHPSPLKTYSVSLPAEAAGLSAVAYHSLLYRQRCTDLLPPLLHKWPLQGGANGNNMNASAMMATPVWHTCPCRTKSGREPALPIWFYKYGELVVATFANVVSPAVFQSPHVLDVTLASIPFPKMSRSPSKECRCRERAPYELVKFHSILYDIVQQKLDAVSIRVPSCWVGLG